MEVDGEEAQQDPPPQQQLEDISRGILNSIFESINVRMLISNDERRCALAIKAAILAEDGLEPLSDMMYAQLALVDRDNVQSAVERARHLQYFREEYDIKDTYEGGCEVSRKFLQHHRGHILSIAYNSVQGNCKSICGERCLVYRRSFLLTLTVAFQYLRCYYLRSGQV